MLLTPRTDDHASAWTVDRVARQTPAASAQESAQASAQTSVQVPKTSYLLPQIFYSETKEMIGCYKSCFDNDDHFYKDYRKKEKKTDEAYIEHTLNSAVMANLHNVATKSAIFVLESGDRLREETETLDERMENWEEWAEKMLKKAVSLPTERRMAPNHFMQVLRRYTAKMLELATTFSQPTRPTRPTRPTHGLGAAAE